MKREALLVEFYRRPLASSPHKRKKKSNFNSSIYALFLDYFCVLIVKIRC